MISELDVSGFFGWINWKERSYPLATPSRELVTVKGSHEAIVVSIDVLDNLEASWRQELGPKVCTEKSESRRIFNI